VTSRVGQNTERQSVGLPGHCDRCAEVGHVVAHPDLGCADVGCTQSHGSGRAQPDTPRTADADDLIALDASATLRPLEDAVLDAALAWASVDLDGDPNSIGCEEGYLHSTADRLAEEALQAAVRALKDAKWAKSRREESTE
jgi:hypothetical protein